ncbi:MAG: two-component sensor histidine kinase, partial [Burkholderiales bacterium]|nr:two-component sensor histidine kinase [Burkholderiales bacterium]
MGPGDPGGPPPSWMQGDPPSMPSNGPPDGPGGNARGGGLPTSAALLDYGIRLLIIGLAAWLGARWLSAPMRRLQSASRTLGQ